MEGKSISSYQGYTSKEHSLSPRKYRRYITNILQSKLMTRREEVKFLMAVAVGEKKLSPEFVKVKLWERTPEDKNRLYGTLRNLLEQIYRLEHQLYLIKEEQI